jgi:predicted nucleic acid-binding Zn finger protein
MVKSERSIINSRIIEKIDELIKSDKIKKIIYLPSKNQIWEIKSNTNNKIYLIDLDWNYCSCRGFYYNFTKGKCYHIKATEIAYKNNKYKVEFLNDEEMNTHLIKQLKELIEKDF